MTTARIRVLIAEDHAVVREGTREILERDALIEVVGEAEDGQQAVARTEELRPDVVVLDVRLPLMNGIEVAGRLRTLSPPPAVLILSAYDDDDYVFAAMEAGASGYLLKTAHGEEVVAAIHSIVRGDVVLQSAVADKFVRRRRGEDSIAAALDGLTGREVEILRFAAMGLRNKEIAIRMDLSRRTVEGHLSHIFTKLCVNSRTEAILVGATRGWFTLDQKPPGDVGAPLGGFRP